MDKDTEGRIPIDIVEIDLDYCSHDFGDSNCQANLSETQAKCFNTLATCGAIDNYSPESFTYRFCSDQEDIPTSNLYYPFIKSASVSPGKINPLGADKSTTTLGKRIVLTVSMSDHPGSDRIIDKYQRERIIGTAQLDGEGYNPLDRSTFWRKFKARNPYYKNRPIRYISGYIEDGVLQDTVTQYFFITNISDSDTSGMVRIEAKDPLYLAQREKALAPMPSEGYLSSGINDSATAFTLSPTGIGSDYSASGYVRVDSEVMSFTRSGDDFTVVRGEFNTTAVAHDSGATVQECLYFNGQLPYQILTTLLEDYAEIDSSYLDTAQWFDESVTKDNLPLAYTALITEPTEVEDLINEMTEQMYFYIWFSSREGTVKIRAVRPIQDDEITSINYDEHIIDGTLSVNEDTGKLITRVVVNYAMIDPTKNLDELTNFAASEVNINLDAESENQYRDKRTKVINSRWITSGGGGSALELAERMLYRFSKPLRTFRFALDAKDRDLWLSDFIQIKSPFVVDSVGNEAIIDAHVIQSQESSTGSIYSHTAEEYVYTPFADDSAITLIRTGAGTANNQDINLRAWYDSEYPATPPQASDIIYFVLEENVIANSTNTSNYAIEVLSSDFPVGCQIFLYIKPNAWVVGKGGGGADGGLAGSFFYDGNNGSNGGVAIYTRFPITIQNQGVIGGGGGGGGAGATITNRNASVPYDLQGLMSGGGGGGGAGYGDGGAQGGSFDRPSLGITPATAGQDGNLVYGARGARGNGDIAYNSGGSPTYLVASVRSGRGGNGGDLGQDGSGGKDGNVLSPSSFPGGNPIIEYSGGDGGTAGDAIDGISYVTWDIKGDVRGDEVN